MWIERLQASLLAEQMHRFAGLPAVCHRKRSRHRQNRPPRASGQGQDVGTQAWAHDPDREN